MAYLFIESECLKAVLELLVAINVTLDKGDLAYPVFEPRFDTVMEIARMLSVARYRPEDFFSDKPKKTLIGIFKKKPDFIINREIPDIDTSKTYTAICMKAEDPRGAQLSISSGGVVYEDAFYAVLACYTLGMLKMNCVLPLSKGNYGNLWKQRSEIIQALKKRRYNPAEYLSECKIFPDGLLRVIEIRGSLPQKMRGLGLTTAVVEKDLGLARYVLHDLLGEPK